MPKIMVTKPFKLSLRRGQERLFGPGEHDVSAEELEHWFVQGCIADGRAHVVAVGDPGDGPNPKFKPETKAKAPSKPKAKNKSKTKAKSVAKTGPKAETPVEEVGGEAEAHPPLADGGEE